MIVIFQVVDAPQSTKSRSSATRISARKRCEKNRNWKRSSRSILTPWRRAAAGWRRITRKRVTSTRKLPPSRALNPAIVRWYSWLTKELRNEFSGPASQATPSPAAPACEHKLPSGPGSCGCSAAKSTVRKLMKTSKSCTPITAAWVFSPPKSATSWITTRENLAHAAVYHQRRAAVFDSQCVVHRQRALQSRAAQ